MLRNLLHRPIAVTMILIAVVAIGVLSLQYIPVSLMPQIDIPKITVQCYKSGASVTEVEQQMITPLRQQLGQVAGLKDIESQSRIDAGTITLSFEPGTDMDILFIDVNEKIDRAMNNMPKDMERPKVIKASAMDIPAFYIDVTSKEQATDTQIREKDIANLSKLVTNVIVKRIEQLPQTAMVDISGTVGTEIICIPDLSKLESLGMSTWDIEKAIDENNIVLGALSVVSGIYRYSIHFDSQIINKQDIENIYIRHQGRLFQLKDVCKVEEKSAVRNGLVLHDKKDAITMAVIKQNDAQMEDLQLSMEALLENMKKDYENVDFTVTRDQTQLLTYSINNLEWNLVLAALLACLILFLFNGGWRTPLLIIISIPLSLILTLLCFYIIGISLNVISLSGLILGVGMIVDNAIIVIDNSPQQTYTDENDGFAKKIVFGVKEVFFPMLSSVLTTCSVFIPLIFLSGTAGALFFDQAMGVTIALFASLIVASIVVPVYYYNLHKPKVRIEKREKPIPHNKILRFISRIRQNIHVKLSAFVVWIKRKVSIEGMSNFLSAKVLHGYEEGMRWTLRNSKTCIFIFFGALITIAGVFEFIKKEKMPEIEHDDALMSIDWNAGLSIDENNRRTEDVINVVNSSIESSTAMIGAQEFILSHTKDITSSEAVVYLKSHSNESLDSVKEAVIAYIGKKYPTAKVDFEISGNIFDIIFQTDKPDLEVRLSRKKGGCPTVLEAEAYIDTLRKCFPDLDIQSVTTEENLQYVADPQTLAYYNVSYSRLCSRLREMVGSSKVYEITSGSQPVPVMLGIKEKRDADEVLKGSVINSEGVEIPISYLVKVNKILNFKRLSAGAQGEYYPVRIDKITDSDAEDVMEQCESMSSLKSTFHGGYFDSREMIGELSMVLLVAIMLLYFILAAQFESLVQPFIILSEIVLDVCIVMLFLWIVGESLNIMSMIGIVVMSGIIINDSILKVDTINRCRGSKEIKVQNGLERACHLKNYRLLKAIIVAGHRRLRPIIMTSLTTILALLPFLHKGDMGSAIQFPLSLTLIVGMTVGTLVSLFFVPLLYFLIYCKRK
ncbi:MAG: efflux RND transporter permease subunit [Bacteroidaceae bacterium]|nr:efflux RND transporter permease subunit [Bacteroidaceae bacterium]